VVSFLHICSRETQYALLLLPTLTYESFHMSNVGNCANTPHSCAHMQVYVFLGLKMKHHKLQTL